MSQMLTACHLLPTVLHRRCAHYKNVARCALNELILAKPGMMEANSPGE